MKKICFITQCSLPIPTVKGGAVETLVEYILDENEKNPIFEFTVISVGDEIAKKDSEKYKHATFLYVEEGSAWSNRFLSEAARYLKYLNISIPASVEFSRALRLLKNVNEQDLFIYEAGPTTHLPLLHKYIPQNKLVVHLHWDGMGTRSKDKCFSYLIPVSDYIGNQWKNASGCAKEKIKPLYNCTKIERFMKDVSEQERNELRQSLGIDQNKKVIIFTGRIVDDKGVKQLLEAYDRLDTQNVTMLIIGSANFGAKTRTKYEEEVGRIISESKKQIVFTGYVHQSLLYKYYSIADVAVMPSMFQDPAPLVCIETQATGTPLIATRVGGIPEYSGENGVILVDKDENIVNSLKSAIDSLINDEETMKSMSEAELKNAIKYTTEKYFSSFCDLMNDIMS